jgi:hypothetical protein
MHGFTAIVCDINTSPPEIAKESVDDLEKGKVRAEQIARDYLKQMDNESLPTVEWKANEKLLRSRS